MTQYNDRIRETLGAETLSIERAQQLKRDARAKREYSTRDLEVLMQEYARKGDENYYSELSGINRVVARVKEFIGRGREYEYKQHLKQLGVMNGQLEVLANNTQEIMEDYRGKMQECRSGLYQDRELFGLNTIIYTEKERQLNTQREELSTLEKQSVLGSSCTTDSLRLHKGILELENDLTDLSQENDDLAVRIMVNNSLLDAQKQTTTKLQEMHGHIQRQRSVFSTHYELALSQEKMVAGLSGVRSGAELYMQSAVLVQQFMNLQGQIDRTSIDELPKEFQLGTPRIKTKGDPSRPYWMTVAPEIRNIGRDA